MNLFRSPLVALDLPRVSLTSIGLMLAMPTVAQDVGPIAAVVPTDIVTVSAGAVRRSDGRVAVNIASGNGNQQLGTFVIANGDAAHGSSIAVQNQESGAQSDRATIAVIESGAFAGMRGAISVNVAAGLANQEANVAVISTGIEGHALSDALLSQTRPSAEPNGRLVQPSSPNDVARLAPDAFAGSQGLIQVNLIGGERNSSANTFVLNVSAGGNP